jgi:hypothetical protein
MHVDRLLDAAIITTASVLLVGVVAIVLFTITAALERWIERPPAPASAPLLPAVEAAAPNLFDQPFLFDQDAAHDTRQAS